MLFFVNDDHDHDHKKGDQDYHHHHQHSFLKSAAFPLFTLMIVTFLTILLLKEVRWSKTFSLMSYFSFWKGPFVTSPYLVGITLQTHSSLLYDRLFYHPSKSRQDSITNYEILGTLHKDIWNTVHKARMISNKRLYVIRVFEDINIRKYNLQPILSDKENLLITMRHWLFPVTHSVFWDEDRDMHIVQNFVYGVRLATLMKDFAEGFPESVSKFITAQVLIAVEYLHKAHVLIRDIHAANIIVQQEGYVKLCSITMGEILDIDSSYSNSLRGRLGFMPPEFIRREIWTKESDCWVFGVFIYHLSFGKTPFESERGIRSTMARINLNRFDIPFFCTYWLKHLIRGLLCTSTQRRFNTADIAKHRWYEEVSFEQMSRKLCTPPDELLAILNKHQKEF